MRLVRELSELGEFDELRKSLFMAKSDAALRSASGSGAFCSRGACVFISQASNCAYLSGGMLEIR